VTNPLVLAIFFLQHVSKLMAWLKRMRTVHEALLKCISSPKLTFLYCLYRKRMIKSLAATAIVGAACVHGFAPAALPSLASRSSAVSLRSPLALRMQDGKDEWKPLIPTKENPMAPDYAKEPTQFERQGLVQSNAPTPKVYNPAMAGGEGLGGLTRRETFAFAGAIGAGTVAVLWAVTRNPGYDKKDTSRDAGNVQIIKEEFAKPELQASLKDLQATR
jgi:hypothetical protein